MFHLCLRGFSAKRKNASGIRKVTVAVCGTAVGCLSLCDPVMNRPLVQCVTLHHPPSPDASWERLQLAPTTLSLGGSGFYT